MSLEIHIFSQIISGNILCPNIGQHIHICSSLIVFLEIVVKWLHLLVKIGIVVSSTLLWFSCVLLMFFIILEVQMQVL